MNRRPPAQHSSDWVYSEATKDSVASIVDLAQLRANIGGWGDADSNSNVAVRHDEVDMIDAEPVFTADEA